MEVEIAPEESSWEASVVIRVFELVASGLSLGAAAERINEEYSQVGECTNLSQVRLEGKGGLKCRQPKIRRRCAQG